MNDISKSIYEIRRIDELGESDTVIHRIDPSIKIIVTIIYIIKVLSIKRFLLSDSICVILYPLILFGFGKIPFKIILKKIVFVIPVIIGVSVVNLIIDFSYGEIYFSLLLLFKCVFALIGSLLLIVTTGINNLVLGLKKMRVPNILIIQLLMLYRYIILMMEECHKVRCAYELRTLGERSMTIRDYGQIVGRLLLKTIDMSENIFEAMKLRGFEGELYIKKSKKARYSDLLYLTVSTLMMILL